MCFTTCAKDSSERTLKGALPLSRVDEAFVATPHSLPSSSRLDLRALHRSPAPEATFALVTAGRVFLCAAARSEHMRVWLDAVLAARQLVSSNQIAPLQ